MDGARRALLGALEAHAIPAGHSNPAPAKCLVLPSAGSHTIAPWTPRSVTTFVV
ncbi:Hypothetical protein A7982_02786 [Minicystis rosea]|nr:Hypothetical protein A7982_02786 [Minicystis rosea]